MNEEIRKAIKTITKDDKEVFGTRCTVKSVNLTKSNCCCLPLDESKADLVNVQLIADEQTGFLLIPAVNSIVTVEYLSNEQYYVSQFSKLQLIKLNGDENGGLVKVQELTDKLNDLENAFNQHLLLYNAHTHTETLSVTTPPIVPDTQILLPTIKTELENQTVKHGNG